MSRPVLGLVILGFLAYGLAANFGIHAHTDPVEMDTVSYLNTALEIRDNGGLLSFIPNCLSGLYRQATQHPMYMLFLSTIANRDIHFFINAKILSAVIGLLFIATMMFCVGKRFGVLSAFVCLVLFLINATFLRLVTMVACEGLFIIFILLFWYFASKGFEREPYWLWAGFFAGFAFMTKSLAILLLPIFFISVLLIRRRQIVPVLKSRYVWGFLLIFITVASPLFIRNIKVYGSPLYSNSRFVLWIDRWLTYDRMIEGRQNSTGPGDYLASHSPKEIFNEIFVRSTQRNIKMTVDGLKPFAFWQRPLDLMPLWGYHHPSVSWQGIWALIMLVLALGGFWHRRKSPDTVIALIAIAVFWMFVGFYSKVFPGTPPTRLLYPVLILVLLYASRGIVMFCGRVFKALNQRILLSLVSVFLVMYTGFLFLDPTFQQDLRKSYRYNSFVVTQLKWAEKNLRPGEIVLVGKNFKLNMFYFEDQIKFLYQKWPTVITFGEIADYVREHKIDYGILDIATIANNFSAYQNDYVLNRQSGIRRKRPLPSWILNVPISPDIPPFYEIYRFDRTNL